MKKPSRFNKYRNSDSKVNETEVRKPINNANKSTKWAFIFSILSLLVSFFGGLPGIRSWIQDSNNKPKLSFRAVNIVIGETKLGPVRKTSILLSGTLTNSGEKPLTPAYFSGKILWENKWKEMENALIPADLILMSDHQKITIDDPQANDLQRYSQKIMPMSPINGHLLFYTDIEKQKIVKNRKLKFLFLCRDITDKEYSCEVEFFMGDLEGEVVYPKQNMKIETK